MNKQYIQQFYYSGIKGVIAVCLLLLTYTAKAQSIEHLKGPHLKYYRGTVYDTQGIPLPNVEIENQITCETVSSGFEGEFSIWGHPGDTVMFTFVDYFIPKEVNLEEAEKFKVTLEEILYYTEIIYDRNMPVYTQRRMTVQEIEAINNDNKHE